MRSKLDCRARLEQAFPLVSKWLWVKLMKSPIAGWLGDVRSFPTQTYQPFPFDPFQVPEHIMERPQEPLFAEAGDGPRVGPWVEKRRHSAQACRLLTVICGLAGPEMGRSHKMVT